MRDWIVLALIAGGVYLGLRQLGCVSSSEEDPSARAEEVVLTATMDPVEDEGGGAAEDGRTAARAPGAADSPAGERARKCVRDEIAALLANEPLRDAEGLAAAAGRPGAVGELATAVLDARTDDAKRRWLGFSRLLAGAELSAGERQALLGRIDTAARTALYAPSESVAQVVRGGDALVRVQDRFRKEQGVVVPIGILRWLNGLSGDLIHPGDELRAPSAPITLKASKSGFWLRLQIGEGVLREFAIGIGKDDKTPAETFILKRPLEHPPWKDPVTGKLFHYGDPEYAIGTRWIGFEPNGPHRGLGIHGTNEPHTIGQAASLGCIRLRNEDVEALSDLVSPGMTIQVVE